MGPTRKRDLTAATVLAGVAGYLLVVLLYRWFPPIDVWTGISLLAVAIGEGGWAFYVRAKINDGEIGDARGWLHPLAVARSVLIAKASAWVGALALGWWIAVLVYLLPRSPPQRWLLRYPRLPPDRKSTRLNSSHLGISYAVLCLEKKKKPHKYYTACHIDP